MMEAIAIFSIACNVMQTISFAHEAVKVARAMRHGGSIDSNLEYTTSHLNTCIQNLKQQLETGMQPITQDCQKLLNIASGSLTTGTAITTELAKIRELSQKSSVHAAVAWLKTITVVKGRLNKLDETLRALQRVLETQLLARICKATDAAAIMNQEGFDEMDHSLRCFVAGLSRGQTALQNLITNESTSIKIHVTGETEKLRQDIKEDISTHSRKFDDKISATVETAQKHQAERQDRERLLRSLTYQGKDSRRDQIKDAHHQTFEWIFASIKDKPTDVSLSNDGKLGQDDSTDDEADSSSQLTDFSTSSEDVEYPAPQWDDFVGWLRSQDRRPYWVSGKAGSGKSTLMLFLAEDSRTLDVLHTNKKSPRILCHYFWAAGDPSLRSAKGFLCSLLHDLLIEDESLHQQVLDRFPKAKWKSTVEDWSNRELEAVTKYAFSVSQMHWCIFVDGIDEAEREDQPLLLDLFTRFCEISNIQLCLSSRPEPHLQHQFQEYPSLRMQDLTKPDIYKYCQDQLGTLGWKNKYEAKEVLEELHSKSSGVFLWVILVLGQLKQGTLYGEDFEALSAHLRALPSDLCDLYQQMWNRANLQRMAYEKDASRYLNIAVTCKNDSMLTHLYNVVVIALVDNPQMATSLIYNYDNSLLKKLRTYCDATKICLISRTAGLLEFAKNGDVDFVHRSAHDFLKFSDFGQKILHLDKTEPIERLTGLLKASIAYIQVLLERNRVATRSNTEIEDPTDLFKKVLDNPGFPSLDWYLFFIQRTFPLEKAAVCKILTDMRVVNERQWWASRSTATKKDFLRVVIEASFFDYATMELNRIHNDRPSGMTVSVAYASFLLDGSMMGLTQQAFNIASGAKLLLTLLERRINSISSNQTDLVHFNTTSKQRFHTDTNLVLRFLRAVCMSDGIENCALMGRLLSSIILAESGGTPVFIHLHSLHQTCSSVDDYKISYVGRYVFESALRNVGPGIVLETNTRTLLMLLWTAAMKPSDQNLASIWEEINAQAQGLEMPLLLRIVAIPGYMSSEYFFPPAGRDLENVLDFIGLDAINHATTVGLQTRDSDSVMQGRLVVMPGITDYTDKLIKGEAPVSRYDVKKQLIAMGRFKEEHFVEDGIPSVYSPI